ncbi:unnamed protein product [Staurois parvus]|uniref:Uncharacterized protein n=1 Tax=Staurois parvus TaxID=386267 RepID=A0ABN9AMP7_9NEOB|nr:unnamed protein product [Staurois parvus]
MNGIWGTEQRQSYFPFKEGSNTTVSLHWGGGGKNVGWGREASLFILDKQGVIY